MRRSARGFVLAVVLLLVAAAALLAGEALSGATLEQALSNAARGRQRAFEAAESGLVLAESVVRQGGITLPGEPRTSVDGSRVSVTLEDMALDAVPTGFSVGAVVVRRLRAMSLAEDRTGARLALEAGYSRIEPAP